MPHRDEADGVSRKHSEAGLGIDAAVSLVVAV